MEEVNESSSLTTQNIEENSEIKIFDKENYNPQINQEQVEENGKKRRKMKHDKSSSLNSRVKKARPVIKKCEVCKQKLDEIILYQGHPNGAVEEAVALTDPKLCIFTGDEDYINEIDARPHNKLTYFR